MSKVVVLGAGQWGTTMAQVLCDAGNHVLMWGRSQDLVDEVNEKIPATTETLPEEDWEVRSDRRLKKVLDQQGQSIDDARRHHNVGVRAYPCGLSPTASWHDSEIPMVLQ